MVTVSSVDFRQNDNIDWGPEARVTKYNGKNIYIFLDLGQKVQSQSRILIFF